MHEIKNSTHCSALHHASTKQKIKSMYNEINKAFEEVIARGKDYALSKSSVDIFVVTVDNISCWLQMTFWSICVYLSNFFLEVLILRINCFFRKN